MRVTEGIAYQRIGKTYIAVLVDVGNMVFLNETAGLILSMLDRGYTKEAVVQDFCTRFEVDEVVVSEDFGSVVEELTALGFLIHEDVPPREIVRQPYDLENDPRIAIRNYCEEKNIPLLALIEVSNACNLRCTHCYIPFENLREIRERRHEKRLRLADYKSLLDQLRELGCFEVVFTGGEPATFPELIDLCEYARCLRFSVSLKTNAAMLGDGTIARLRRLHITEVQTSLYSMNPEVHDCITRSKGSWLVLV